MKKQLVIIGAIILLVCVGLSGCNENKNSTVNNGNYTQDDIKFLYCCLYVLNFLDNNTNVLSDYIDQGKYGDINIISIWIYSNAREFQKFTDVFSVSTELMPMKQEFVSYLEAIKNGAYHYIEGYKNMSNESIIRGRDYFNESDRYGNSVHSEVTNIVTKDNTVKSQEFITINPDKNKLIGTWNRQIHPYDTIILHSNGTLSWSGNNITGEWDAKFGFLILSGLMSEYQNLYCIIMHTYNFTDNNSTLTRYRDGITEIFTRQ